jgi:hypothetical protein
VLENKDFQPDYFLTYMYPLADSVRTRAQMLQERRLSVFHAPQYAVPEALFHDTLGQYAADVLRVPSQPVQMAPDFIVLLRPAVHIGYAHRIQALFADIGGQIFPMYYKEKNNTRAANPSAIYEVSAISKRVFAPGVYPLTYKALMKDGSYYIVPTGMAFEIK